MERSSKAAVDWLKLDSGGRHCKIFFQLLLTSRQRLTLRAHFDKFALLSAASSMALYGMAQQSGPLPLKLNILAPATITAVLLTLTSYSIDIDNAVRDALGVTHPAQDNSDAPAPGTQPLDASKPAENVPAALADDIADNQMAQKSAAAAPVIERDIPAGRNDSLPDILARAGVGSEDSAQAITAIAKVFNPKDIHEGQVFDVALQSEDGETDLVSIDFDIDKLRSISLESLDEGGFRAQEIKSKLTGVQRAALGTIEGSMYDAGYKARIPSPILAAFIRAYSYSVDFQRDLQPGDKFAVLYDATVNDNGDVIRTGNILAAFLRVGDRPQRIYLYRTQEGSVQYFTADGKAIRRTLLRTPVDGARITSGFGMRMHPLLGYTKMHKGVDFGAPPGTPVLSAGDGIIEKMGWWGGYGKYIRIRHTADTGTAYAHLSRFNPSLHEGSRVRQGQIIALTGSTGASTGPHLHFEVLKHGVQVNPLTAAATMGTALSGRDLAEFRQVVAQRDKQFRELINPPQVASGNQTTNKLE